MRGAWKSTNTSLQITSQQIRLRRPARHKNIALSHSKLERTQQAPRVAAQYFAQPQLSSRRTKGASTASFDLQHEARMRALAVARDARHAAATTASRTRRAIAAAARLPGGSLSDPTTCAGLRHPPALEHTRHQDRQDHGLHTTSHWRSGQQHTSGHYEEDSYFYSRRKKGPEQLAS